MTYKAAMTSSASEKWLGAMKSKIESLYDNQVCNLVDLLEGARHIKYKEIYKIKIEMKGKIVVY